MNKVLILDVDHNQGDLTANFGLEPSDGAPLQPGDVVQPLEGRKGATNHNPQHATRNTANALIQAADPSHQNELQRIFLQSSGGSPTLRHSDDSPDIARSIMEAKRLPGVLRFERARST